MSNLNEAFWKWFRGSVVMDKRGDPLVVYHGSPDVRGLFAEGFRSLTRGEVFFATDSLRAAETYADDHRAFDYQNAEPGVVPLYLAIKNPMVIHAGGKLWRDTEKHVAEAKARGHDGIVIHDSADDYQISKKTKPSTVYAFFKSSQAKSAITGRMLSRVDRKPIAGATANDGTWDADDPKITSNPHGPQGRAYVVLCKGVKPGTSLWKSKRDSKAEMVMERVRREQFPDKPSRQNAIYLAPSKKDAALWMDYVQIKDDCPPEIVPVAWSGVAHYGDGNLLDNVSEALFEKDVSRAEAEARRYWSGGKSGFEMKELVVQGEAAVLAENPGPTEFWGRAGAGVLFRCTADDTYLLTMRSGDVEQPGTWGIPGGACGKDGFHASSEGMAITETEAFACAKRETIEELSWWPVKHSVREAIVYQKDKFQYTTFVVDISAKEKKDSRLAIGLNWENDQYEWFTLQQIRVMFEDLHFGMQHVLQYLEGKR